MAKGPRQTDAAAYEEVIRSIREVLAARVVTGPSGAIEEVHVLAGPGRHAKQIVRDIESACTAQFGVALDHKKISVAQVRGPEGGSRGTRLKLKGIHLGTEGIRVAARVDLEWDGKIFTGEAAGHASGGNRKRLLAQATLDAVEECFQTGGAFALEDVHLCPLGHRMVALVGVSLFTREGEEMLTGSSAVREDEREAIVRAALDAINRRLGWVCRPARETLNPSGEGDNG
ncbi:MAG: hypothetical protein RDU89_07305 [bacterium]|nr:hypothetical protein [bacterium]